MPKITTLLSRILKLDLFKAQAFNKNCWILQNFNILKNILFQFITKFLRKMHLKKSCYPNKKQKENEVFSFEVMGTRNFWQSNWCRLLERECGIPNLVVLSRLSVFYLLEYLDQNNQFYSQKSNFQNFALMAQQFSIFWITPLNCG